MPELPEVETIRRDLVAELLNRQITQVIVKKPKMVQKQAVTDFIKRIENHKFIAIERIGKLLIFQLDNGWHMLVHLKMTGQLIYQDDGHIIAGGHTLAKKEDNFVVPNKYTHLIWQFSGGRKLYFNDLRQFGYVKLVTADELAVVKAGFGMEPLNPQFTASKFTQLLARRPKTSIKAALLDQKLIAGIGNIYADEACHMAHIRPGRLVKDLQSTEIKRLTQALKNVLRLSIKHRGTTFNDYVDAKGNKGNFVKLLRVYGRGGKKCLSCGKGVIIKIKLVGRGTHYCPVCQK